MVPPRLSHVLASRRALEWRASYIVYGKIFWQKPPGPSKQKPTPLRRAKTDKEKPRKVNPPGLSKPMRGRVACAIKSR